MIADSIQLPDDGSCAFCAYLNGTRPYTILARDEVTAMLITREQRGVAHLLVIPVRHVETILDLSDEEAGAVMIAVREAARVIDRAERRPGIAVWQNNGVPAGQSIGHVHFHVAGTLPGGRTEWGDVPELSISETEALADKLRAVRDDLASE
ncbi:HIT domain-containing protein [Streptosporangium sp. NPDC002524]|uniref:HIT family protein n=1 Tax=Streptosporangium sp. NPDC002524 TaxID=3154537 RepID=UPI0033330C00